MPNGEIWVYGEVQHGAPTSSTLEMVTKASELGTTTVVFLGEGAEQAAAAAGEYGASRALVDPNPTYSRHLTLPAVDALSALIQQHQPRLVMFSISYDSRDVASAVAARLGVGVLNNATDIQPSGDGYRVFTPWGTTTVATCEITTPVQFVLVRPKAFTAEQRGGGCSVERFEGELSGAASRVRITDTVEEASEGPSLADAALVVSGGRGLGKAENFSMVEELASLLGGAVGATRAVVDAGWRPYGEQVGQTGVTVKPSVYIACGISGAVQHLAGMKGSKYIIAINRDPEAPIFRNADLGVVGDVAQVLPRLNEEIRRRKGR